MKTRITDYRILLIIATILFVSCKDSSTQGDHDSENHDHGSELEVALTLAQIQNAGIKMGKIEPRELSGSMRVNGVLDVPPQQLVTVSAPIGGFLLNTSLLEGSQVTKGQVIATLQNLDFIQIQQDYLEAKSQHELAVADYERQQRLAQENVNSQKTLQQAKTTLATWRARWSGLTEKLKVLNIDIKSVEAGDITSTIRLFAPITGYVTEVNVNIGKFVNPSDVLFEIVDTRHLHAELIVFEKDVPKLRIGQKVRFTLANETQERTAKVYLIGREIGPDRTIQIHCHIDQEDRDLLPGMYLSAVVESDGARVPSLPNEALLDYKGKKYIFISGDQYVDIKNTRGGGVKVEKQTDKHFILYEVQSTVSEAGFTEVIAPDSILNTDVVIKGGYSILSKMKNSEDEGHGH